MVKKIRVVQFGCGPIGCKVVKLALAKPDIEIVGAIDLVNVGRDLGEVADFGRKIGVLISQDVEAVLHLTNPDIVMHTTGSSLTEVYPQLEVVIKAGTNIVSSCEELSYPYYKQPDLANAIDRIAKDHQVTVLGTGVNPGFLMDTWPLAMTAVCQDVKQMKAVRIQDASPRRAPFQKKIGAGCTLEEFKKLVDAGTLKHVGLAESLAMIADGLGWELEEINEELEPVVAKTEVRSDFITVKPGQASGVKQVAHGFKKGQEVITLDFQAYLGAEEPRDAIYISGTPNIEVVIKGGINGDIATAAIIVNSIPRVIRAPAGLLTMKDIPIVSAW